MNSIDDEIDKQSNRTNIDATRGVNSTNKLYKLKFV